ncbi:hypothetical protein M8J76_013240 [Diaphorina citri]|nr:hypothetical protein M8J76_013240 [Diaphorina citri]
MMSSASMTSYLHHCTVLACGLFCLGLFDTTQAQRPAFGKCPHLKTVDNFDVQKFEGQWFEVERSFYVLELAAACTSFNFTVKNDGSFKVLIKTKNRITGSINKNNGIATPSSSNAGLLQYRVDSRLPVVMARMLPTSGLYYVLHTDYDHYAILWSCSNLGLFHADQIWVLGRERDLEVGDRTFVYQTLQDLGLDEGRLVLTKHANCPAES